MILQLNHLPSLSLVQLEALLNCALDASPCMPVIVLYCKLKMFCFFVFMHYLCEKYYLPIALWYYIANCVNWVPRPTFLDLQISCTFKHALGTELIHVYGTYCMFL